MKTTLRKVEHENADMKFLNNQYIHKIRLLEKENKAKTDKIQQLQEKNLQAVVQTPGTLSDYVLIMLPLLLLGCTFAPCFGTLVHLVLVGL